MSRTEGGYKATNGSHLTWTAWIIGTLVLISFFDIVKISLDSYQIAQHSQQPNQNEITKGIEETGTRSLRQKWDILYV